MINLYYRGGPLFMTLIILAGLFMAGIAVYFVIKMINGDQLPKSRLKAIPIAGSLAFMLGILAQAIGLYQAMSAIQAAGDVSPALLAGGFQVSMIAPIFGIFIFIISLIVYLCISFWYKPENVNSIKA